MDSVPVKAMIEDALEHVIQNAYAKTQSLRRSC